MTDPAGVAALAMLDQIRAQVRDKFPDKSQQWRDVWTLRSIHYALHDGDMTGAPDYPEEGDRG